MRFHTSALRVLLAGLLFFTVLSAPLPLPIPEPAALLLPRKFTALGKTPSIGDIVALAPADSPDLKAKAGGNGQKPHAGIVVSAADDLSSFGLAFISHNAKLNPPVKDIQDLLDPADLKAILVRQKGGATGPLEGFVQAGKAITAPLEKLQKFTALAPNSKTSVSSASLGNINAHFASVAESLAADAESAAKDVGGSIGADAEKVAKDASGSVGTDVKDAVEDVGKGLLKDVRL